MESRRGMFDCHHRLLGDILRLVTEAGDAISVMEFYESIYNFTPPMPMTLTRQSSRALTLT
jgi:hypothetical protein